MVTTHLFSIWKRSFGDLSRVALFLLPTCWVALVQGQVLVHVTDYATGNLSVHDFNGNPVSTPSSYTPISGSPAGADGMFRAQDGRLYISRDGGAVVRRSTDGLSFSTFTTIPGNPILLDLTGNSTHLFAARYGTSTIYQINLSDGSNAALSAPTGFNTADGVRIGPDGRLYAVDSSNGAIFAYDLSTQVWSSFLSAPPTPGIASQMEFWGDQVFVSRTISGQASIYRYTLSTPGDFLSGLNPDSEALIGAFAASTATGIRIGPDDRLYANAFDLGEVWRSTVGITAMEAAPFITGLDQPGSIYFAAIPEPNAVWLALAVGLIPLLRKRARRRV
jgi:outer membrane protein assembly factor BamB